LSPALGNNNSGKRAQEPSSLMAMTVLTKRKKLATTTTNDDDAEHNADMNVTQEIDDVEGDIDGNSSEGAIVKPKK